MKSHFLTLTLLAAFPVQVHADPILGSSQEACKNFSNDMQGNIFRDLDNLFQCPDWTGEVKTPVRTSMDKELDRRYPTLGLAGLHRLASENEFRAKAEMGKSYFFLKAKFHRVSSASDGSLMFELYNGGGNKYIFDQVQVPLETYRQKLADKWIWNETLKQLDEELPVLSDGDEITFICHRDRWRVRSPYAEDFTGCVYYNSGRAKQ